MLLQILRSLETLTAEITFVWFQGHVHTDVRGDVITLHSCGPASVPTTSEIEIICAFTTDMDFTDVILFSPLMPIDCFL